MVASFVIKTPHDAKVLMKTFVLYCIYCIVLCGQTDLPDPNSSSLCLLDMNDCIVDWQLVATVWIQQTPNQPGARAIIVLTQTPRFMYP